MDFGLGLVHLQAEVQRNINVKMFQVDTINLQILFIFAVIWGLCSTIPEESKKKFDTYFRNLMDGLVKGFSKPTSFKLARSNLFGDQGTIFEYMINPDNPGSWCKWQDQVILIIFF